MVAVTLMVMVTAMVMVTVTVTVSICWDATAAACVLVLKGSDVSMPDRYLHCIWGSFAIREVCTRRRVREEGEGGELDPIELYLLSSLSVSLLFC